MIRAATPRHDANKRITAGYSMRARAHAATGHEPGRKCLPGASEAVWRLNERGGRTLAQRQTLGASSRTCCVSSTSAVRVARRRYSKRRSADSPSRECRENSAFRTTPRPDRRGADATESVRDRCEAPCRRLMPRRHRLASVSTDLREWPHSSRLTRGRQHGYPLPVIFPETVRRTAATARGIGLGCAGRRGRFSASGSARCWRAPGSCRASTGRAALQCWA